MKETKKIAVPKKSSSAYNKDYIEELVKEEVYTFEDGETPLTYRNYSKM